MGPGRDERSFWSVYGVDLIVPLLVGEEDVELMGLLLVGPKRDGRAVNGSDRQLLTTLADQIAMALESARAFEQIQSLKEGLELQVRERTHQLSAALHELQETQSKLVETQTLSTLARVVAGVVHELNSPLGGLRSSSDSLRRLVQRWQPRLERLGEGPEGAQMLRLGGSLLDLMDDAAERIHQVVTGLAQFVSLDGAPEQKVELQRGLESVIALLKPQIRPGVEIKRRYLVADVSVRANPARLNQVLFNLLENALKALDGVGQIEISIDLRDGWAVVMVRDDGCGIAAEELPRLFEFGFGRKASGRVGLRTGLVNGKRVIEQLGGRLEVASASGQGTSVTVLLPAESNVGVTTP